MQPIIEILSSTTGLIHIYLPFLISMMVSAIGEKGYSDRVPAIAVATGFAVSFTVAVAPVLPVWPPVTPVAKLPYVVGASAIATLLFGANSERRVYLLATIVGGFAAVLWIGADMGDPLGRYPLWAALLVLASAATLVTVQNELTPEVPFARPISLLTALLVLSVAAIDYGSRIGLHGLALAASIGGVLVTAKVRQYPLWGPAVNLVGMTGFIAMATILFLLRAQLALPVGIAFLAFFSGEIALLANRFFGARMDAVAFMAATAVLVTGIWISV